MPSIPKPARQSSQPQPLSERLDDLARSYYAPLAAFFRKRTRSTLEVEDLVQQVFLRLAQIRDLPEMHNPEGYIFQTAANTLKDHLRRERITMRLRALDGDCWVGADLDEFSISLPHPVGRRTPLRLTRTNGTEVTGFTLALEPAAAPALFARMR